MNRLLLLLILVCTLVACGRDATPESAGPPPIAPGDYERGPHNGRLLKSGDFALEITIFETNVPPQFRLYAYQNGAPLNPALVAPVIELHRLDGEVNRFEFTSENDYLRSPDTVVEPHSFDVKVSVQHGGQTHVWAYDSYEGRTAIPAEIAADAGIVVEAAGPAVIRDTLRLAGSVVLDANRRASVRARFPGLVRSVDVRLGDAVRRGQMLASVESNDSLRTYSVTAPFDGVVLARNTNVGDVAGNEPLFEIVDLSEVWVELRAIGTDADRVLPGQPVRIRSATGSAEADAVVDTLLPTVTQSQGVVARLALPNAEGRWRPGAMVTGEVTVGMREVPLAVKEAGLQRFRDFTVVFAQVADTYEVRMLDLGERDGEHVEVLGGLKPGTRYVTEQSFLIRADIEKSGASHDH